MIVPLRSEIEAVIEGRVPDYCCPAGVWLKLLRSLASRGARFASVCTETAISPSGQAEREEQAHSTTVLGLSEVDK